MPRFWVILLLAFAGVANAQAGGRLVVEQAWIRAAPPGAMMLAAYATMRNEGDASLSLIGVDSADFASVSMHETVAENGIERMRPLERVEIPSGAHIEFSPGGKHFMLMRPARELRTGDTVKIHIATAGDHGATVEFTVREEAPTSH